MPKTNNPRSLYLSQMFSKIGDSSAHGGQYGFQKLSIMGFPKLSESLKYSPELRTREKSGAGLPIAVSPLNPVIAVLLYIPKDKKMTAQMKNKNVKKATRYIFRLVIGFIVGTISHILPL